MGPGEKTDALRAARLLILGILAVLFVGGMSIVVLAIARSGEPALVRPVDALAGSEDECVVCHRRTSPGIVQQYGRSTMAAAEVGCRECHEVEAGYPGSSEHEGSNILGTPTTAKCAACHASEVAQYYQSRHSLPAYVAFAGTGDLTPEQLAQFEAVPEGGFAPDKMRNALFALEGPAVTRFACEMCHNVGRPQADGSVGECEKCHLRHEFSLEQARKPETCNACHIGPDHPQWEIYQESPHGIAYATGGESWNWDAEPGTLTVSDFPAPTCAICHVSGFGTSATTHDVGDRLTWFLFAPISQRRPAWQDNQVRMQSVCRSCHNEIFIEEFYAAADVATEAVNAWVSQSDAMVAPLQERGLLTSEPFDEPFDFVYFELWHHWGRTAKFGTWMQGPDYVQWHGAYEVLSDLAELGELVDAKLQEAGP
jgi:hypothetical protein